MKTFASSLCVLLLLAGENVRASTLTWLGTTDNKWTTAANWSTGTTIPTSSDTVVFAGAASQMSTSLNNTAFSVGSIIYNADAAAYTISSNTLTLGSAITDNSSADQTIVSSLSMSSSRSFAVNAGRLFLTGIVKGNGGINKSGAGTLVLNSTVNNSYIGATSITAGSLLIGANGNGLVATTGVTIGGGATLGFYADNITATATAAKLSLGGAGTVSIIDFGSGFTANTLAFADSSSVVWNGTLSIYNWSANDVLSFSSSTGLNASTQLGKITFYSDAGITELGIGSSLGANGAVGFNAVPEPSALALAAMGAAGLLFLARRRATA